MTNHDHTAFAAANPAADEAAISAYVDTLAPGRAGWRSRRAAEVREACAFARRERDAKRTIYHVAWYDGGRYSLAGVGAKWEVQSERVGARAPLPEGAYESRAEALVEADRRNAPRADAIARDAAFWAEMTR